MSKPLHPRGCLFCLSSEGPFKSREHPFPESLGSTEIVSRGVVCDPCNNGPLSRLDQTLLEFPPVAMLRATNGVVSKSGALPVSKWGNGVLRLTGPNQLFFETNSQKAFVEKSPGKLQLQLHSAGPMTAEAYSRIARAVWKMGLEFIYVDEGLAAFDPKFDELREMILRTRPAKGWLLFPRKAEPDEWIKEVADLIEF